MIQTVTVAHHLLRICTLLLVHVPCVRVRSEVNLERAATQLQLPTNGMSRFKLRLLESHTNWAATHAQSHQEHGGDGVESKHTQHIVLRHAENQKKLLHWRASKNHQGPQNAHMHPVNPIIPSNLINHLEPSFSDLLLPFYHDQTRV